MRKLAWAATTLAVVAALVLVGGGWYFSNLIIDGIQITPKEPPSGYRITAVQGDTLTYEVPDSVADPATFYHNLYRTGMFLPNGYVQLSRDAQIDGRSATRTFEVISGEGPAVGDDGTMDWAAWPSAEALGLVSKQVTYDAPLGPTPAVVAQPAGEPRPGRWAIVVHGIGGTNREGLRIGQLLAERGYTTMFINYRDDWQEPDVPVEDGIGNFGQTEWEDLAAAVEYAKSDGATEILLVGYSMGGAVVSSFMRNGDTDEIIGTVLHCPAVNFRDSVVFGAERMGLPVGLLGPLIWSAERITEARTGLRFAKLDYIDGAESWPVPALVMTASDDDLVPPASVEQFSSKLPDGVFYEFAGAAHTGEWNIGPARYREIVDGWLDQLG